MARLKSGPRVSRKTAPSIAYKFNPEEDEDGNDSAASDYNEDSEIEIGVGRVEHLGSDLPDAALSESLSVGSPSSLDSIRSPVRAVTHEDRTGQNKNVKLSLTDGPSRQLLEEAAAHSSPLSKSPRRAHVANVNRATDENERALLSPTKSVRFSLAATDEPQPRVSTGKLRRPSTNTAQAPNSSLKRKTNDGSDAPESPTKRFRQDLPADLPNDNSNKPFREEDWDVQDGNERLVVASSKRGAEKLSGQGEDRESLEEANKAPEKRKRGRPSNASLAEQTAKKGGPSKPQEQAQELPTDEYDREEDDEVGQDDIQSTTSPRRGPKSVTQPQAASKKPMTSRQAKAVSAISRNGHQRTLKGRQGNVFNGEEHPQQDPDVEHIKVPGNVPKMKPKQRRPKATMDDHHQAESRKASSNSSAKNSKGARQQREERDDDTTNELFKPDGDQASGGSEVDEEEAAEYETTPEDARRFFGQFKLLIGIEKVIEKPDYRHKPTTQTLKKLHSLCRTVVELFDKMEDSEDDEESQRQCESAIAEKVTELQRLASKLNPDSSADGKLYAYDVYQSTFSGLTRVFLTHCYFFESHGGLDADALKDLISLAKSIIDLRNNAVTWRAKPDPSSAIVRPIANDVVAPLKKVCDVFRRQQRALQRVEELRREEAAAREFYEKREREEAAYEQQVARERDQMRRLRDLYLTRQEVEPDRKRRAQLGLPQVTAARFGRQLDIDANGSEFVRIYLFGSRNTSLHRRPLSLAPAVWTAEQRLDFMEGLERFGESNRAFSDIMETYCGPRGSLRDFKVHQLLEEAAGLREDLLRAEERNDAIRVPDFIRELPDLDLLDYLVRKYS